MKAQFVSPISGAVVHVSLISNQVGHAWIVDETGSALIPRGLRDTEREAVALITQVYGDPLFKLTLIKGAH